ncbi:hypothetical protein SASPL_121161 [Salvia splendens]|uniref:Uncharacterized protein n=1 Tax=Salvia splendens TaxID=180675 RepID=A0A8X8XTU4_SALSN|nr:hypothetical protein SASPL_121161 [Salvia splendens]
MNPQIPTHATFFYREKWNATMDTLLLSTVIKLRTGRRLNDDYLTDTVLNEACKTNPLAGAYYYRDEPEYSRLTTMFGLHDVKKEKSCEVITISDTTELIVITDSPVTYAPTRGKHIPSPADPDEVNSPFIDPCTLVHRKLFDEPSTYTDQMSPSMAGGVVGSMDPTRYLPVKQLYSSPKGSSCASWSPAAPSRKSAP